MINNASNEIMVYVLPVLAIYQFPACIARAGNEQPSRYTKCAREFPHPKSQLRQRLPRIDAGNAKSIFTNITHDLGCARVARIPSGRRSTLMSHLGGKPVSVTN